MFLALISSVTRQARTNLEKLSIIAWIKSLYPGLMLTTVTSTCRRTHAIAEPSESEELVCIICDFFSP